MVEQDSADVYVFIGSTCMLALVAYGLLVFGHVVVPNLPAISQRLQDKV